MRWQTAIEIYQMQDRQMNWARLVVVGVVVVAVAVVVVVVVVVAVV